MRRILLAFLLLCATILPIHSEALAADWNDWTWEGTWFGDTAIGGFIESAAHLVVSGVASVVNTFTCDFGYCINDSSSFTRRLASYTENSCWFCGVLGDVFDIANDIVTQMCSSMQPVFLTLLGLGMLFWLLFRVGKAIINITPEVDSALVPDVVKQVIRVMVAFLLMTFYIDVFDYAISPVLQLSIGIGNEVMGQEITGYTLTAKRGSGEATPSKRPALLAEEDLCQELEAASKAVSKPDYKRGDKVFDEVMKESFLCYVRIGSASMMTGMAIGSTAIHAWSDMGLLSKLTHMQLPMIGLEIFFSFFALFLAFPLKLFDPLVNLAFVSAMFPLWVVLWAFPFGKEYVKKAIDMFSGVIVHLIVISIMSVIVINIMNSALGSKEERNAMFQALVDGDRVADIFEGVGRTGWSSAALGGFGLVGKATLMTAALGFFAFKLYKKTKDIAKEFKGSIIFGANEAAGELSGGATKPLAKTTSSLAYAGLHARALGRGGAGGAGGAGGGAGGLEGSGLSVSRRNTRLGKFSRGAMMLGGGLPGMWMAMRRSPGNTGTTIGETLRASPLGRLFKRNNIVKEKDPVTGAHYTLNRESGVGVKRNRDGSFVRYNQKTHDYTEVDQKGNVSTYNANTGKVTLNGNSYAMHDGKWVDMAGNDVVDPNIKVAAENLRARADNNESGWVDIQTRFERRWGEHDYSQQ